MSKIINLLEVSQPSGLVYAKQGEVFKVPQTCNSCNGKGGRFVDSRAPDYEYESGEHYEPCKVCKGSGELEAQIVIGWMPHGEVKEEYRELAPKK